MEEFAGVIAIDCKVAPPTVNVVEPVIAPDVALIEVEPGPMPVASPDALIVATAPDEALQETDPVIAFVLPSV